MKTSFVADPVILCPRLCVPASVSCGFPPLSLYEHVRIEQGTDRPEGLGRGVKPAPSSEEEGVPPSRLHATALWTVAAAAPSLLTRHIPPPPPPVPVLPRKAQQTHLVRTGEGAWLGTMETGHRQKRVFAPVPVKAESTHIELRASLLVGRVHHSEQFHSSW